ncbi:helix-turn-helix transcriptional regulator [Sorangium sp. So ce119]|uniref:helix-turn-helix domain-containing protein n=1 Tax=Sorangium sp. So ce119 TaxID=3133279 RepID=UPI003F646A1C
MSFSIACKIWGSAAVRHALAEPNPDPATRELCQKILKHADPPGAFRAWALAQPWPRFCAIVRIVSGEERREVDEAVKERIKSMARMGRPPKEDRSTVAGVMVHVRLTPGEVETVDAEVERQRAIAPPGLADKVSRSSVIKGLISTLRQPAAAPAPAAPPARSPARESSESDVRELMARCFERGLTQAQLAKLSGVERSQISRFHTQNATKPPMPPEKVAALARALRAWEAKQK